MGSLSLSRFSERLPPRLLAGFRHSSYWSKEAVIIENPISRLEKRPSKIFRIMDVASKANLLSSTPRRTRGRSLVPIYWANGSGRSRCVFGGLMHFKWIAKDVVILPRKPSKVRHRPPCLAVSSESDLLYLWVLHSCSVSSRTQPMAPPSYPSHTIAFLTPIRPFLDTWPTTYRTHS